MRMIDRFDEYMKHKRLNDNQVSKQLGLTNGVIGKSRKEGRDLSARVLELIENYYTDLNISWLRTGEGEMLKPQPAIERDEPLVFSGDAKILVMQMSATLHQQEANIAKLAEMVDRLTGGAEKPKKESAG
jgi:hypothetical protein